MKKIAVLGAAGFVGQNLTSFLQDRYEVTAVARKELNLLDAESVASFFQDNGFDVVFHCANQGGSRKTAYDVGASDVVSHNLRMFFNVERGLREGRSPEAKLISFGSGAQYEKRRDLRKVSEDAFDQFVPGDAYGFGKYVLSRYFREQTRGPMYSPVIFGLYGWKEDYSFKFISNGIVKNLLRMPLVIHQNVLFDYLFIEDFLRIMERNIEEDFVHKEYNITPTQSIDLVRICQIINSCGGYESEILRKNPGYNFEYTGDNHRLLENVGTDFSFTSYEMGIRKLYEYYETHLQELDLERVRKDEAISYCRSR